LEGVDLARFDVHVVPGSRRPGPDGRYGGLPRVRVKAPATDGRANAEAERVLADLLKTTVRLVAGARSRRKTFEAAGSRYALDARIRGVFGD
jgi:uncharacterized protein YggU (UPF0235/DUF167 family)